MLFIVPLQFYSCEVFFVKWYCYAVNYKKKQLSASKVAVLRCLIGGVTAIVFTYLNIDSRKLQTTYPHMNFFEQTLTKMI